MCTGEVRAPAREEETRPVAPSLDESALRPKFKGPHPSTANSPAIYSLPVRPDLALRCTLGVTVTWNPPGLSTLNVMCRKETVDALATYVHAGYREWTDFAAESTCTLSNGWSISAANSFTLEAARQAARKNTERLRLQYPASASAPGFSRLGPVLVCEQGAKR